MGSRTPSSEDLAPISVEWILSGMEHIIIMAEDIPYITVPRITFKCRLGVLAGVNVLRHNRSHGIVRHTLYD